MLTNWFSPTVRLRSWMASTVSPLMAWKVLVRLRTSIRAMSFRQVRAVDVGRHLEVLVEKSQLVKPRQGVLKILGRHPGIRPAVHVLVREIELLQHRLRRLEVRGDQVEDGLPVLGLVD